MFLLIAAACCCGKKYRALSLKSKGAASSIREWRRRFLKPAFLKKYNNCSQKRDKLRLIRKIQGRAVLFIELFIFFSINSVN